MGKTMTRTLTVQGIQLSGAIADLEGKGCEIRSLTRGNTNSEWILSYDDMKDEPTDLFKEK